MSDNFIKFKSSKNPQDIPTKPQKKKSASKSGALKTISKRVWGGKEEYYNTVGDAVGDCFIVMQAFRAVFIIMLFVLIIIYFYIYVRNAFAIYGFYGLLTTFAAFVCLFIGSGKQVVY